jgi:hypothetical protein
MDDDSEEQLGDTARLRSGASPFSLSAGQRAAPGSPVSAPTATAPSPASVGAGGNAGNQSSIKVIRGLVSGGEGPLPKG